MEAGANRPLFSGSSPVSSGQGAYPRMGSQPATSKTVFFVRHGESFWNKGQHEFDLRAMCMMASRHDHALSDEGIEQARSLERDILRAISLPKQSGNRGLSTSSQGSFASTPTSPTLEADMSMEEKFLACKMVFCSPLTRALQTATIALRPLLLKPKHRPDPATVQVISESRERRNRGGRDSEGSKTGDAIKQKMKGWLKGIAEEYQEVIDNIDCSQVQDKFGTEVETTGDVEKRMDEFITKLKECPETCIICVGHSHFFRECFRMYGRNDESARKFRSTILRNCGVVGVRIEFNEGSDASTPAAEFHDPKLLFGTRMVDRKEACCRRRTPAETAITSHSSSLAILGCCRRRRLREQSLSAASLT